MDEMDMFSTNNTKPSVEENLPRHIVFSGGAVMGIQHIGVLRAIQEEKKLFQQIESVAGSSIGGFAAACAGVDVSASLIQEAFLKNIISLLRFLDLEFRCLPETKPVTDYFSQHLLSYLEHMFMPRALKKSLLFFSTAAQHILLNVLDVCKSGGLFGGKYIEQVIQTIYYYKLSTKKELIVSKINAAISSEEVRKVLLLDKKTYSPHCEDADILFSLKQLKVLIEGQECGNLTFEGLHQLRVLIPELNFKDVYITGSDSTWLIGCGLVNKVFSYKMYPNMALKLAVHCSMAIPGIFKKVTYQSQNYVDGGWTNNTPVNIFADNEATKNNRIISVVFGSADFDTGMSPDLKKQTIYLGELGISPLNFFVTEEQKKKLIENGYAHTRQHLLERGYISKDMKPAIVVPLAKPM